MYENKSFLPNYQEELFKNTKSDLEICESKRKLMSMSHSASINLSNSDTTCLLLENNLEQYTEVVDNLKDKTSVNNYAEFCLSLASNCPEKPNVKLWKSNASRVNIDFNKLFSCNENDNNGCKNSQVSKNDVLFLQEAIKGKSTEKINIFRDVNINKNQLTHEPFTKAVPHKNAKANFSKGSFNNPEPDSVITLPVRHINEFHNTPNISLKNKHNFNVYNKAPKQNNERPLNQNANPFRSAKDELILQNVKKDSRGENPTANNPLFCYGSNKRSLGARRGGVSGKFVPPLRSQERVNNQLHNEKEFQNEEPVDERLKNIDPKMVELIKSEIMDNSAPVAWDDIAGLEFAKSSVQESVVWPILRPDIFTGLRRPPKGILLFGPPGTGKTLIGKCIASQSNSTFFSISASSLTSKWVGDGEKMVRALFAVALVHQPAVVFIDEIDSLLSQRSDSEHESSRRIKTEFLVQLDGASTGEEDRVLVVGATNRPQELDEAARRRLVKRLYIPLPENDARRQIVVRLMQSERHNLTDAQIDHISELSDGYSGSDMKNLCQEASLGPIRSIDMRMMQNIRPDQVRPICMDDFQSALNRVRASVSSKDLNLYKEWNKLYGSG